MWIQTNTQGLINMESVAQIELLFVKGSDPTSLMLTTTQGKEIPLDFASEEMCMTVFRNLIEKLNVVFVADLTNTPVS